LTLTFTLVGNCMIDFTTRAAPNLPSKAAVDFHATNQQTECPRQGSNLRPTA
jgi:hypothetical protein